MLNNYSTHIVSIGNSKGIRIPKEYLAALGTTNVVLERVENGIMIRPVSTQLPPRTQWAAILSKMHTNQNEPELTDWNITINDGIEDL